MIHYCLGCGRLIVGEWSSDEQQRFNLNIDTNIAETLLIHEKKGFFFFISK